ncbi:MAG: serine hydrolase [Phycisphaerales bacterium]|nr:serine hydrolase [Phycisphaerales bacterium]
MTIPQPNLSKHLRPPQATAHRRPSALPRVGLLLGLGSFFASAITGSVHGFGAVSASLAAADALELAGNWSGAVTTPAGKLEFVLRFSSNTAGVISIPTQGVKDVPLEAIAVDAGSSPAKVTFRIKEVAGIGGGPTFSGQCSADGKTISGDFRQGGGSFPFEITRGDSSKALTDSLAGLDEFLAKAIIDWKVPGMAVAIIKGDEIVYAKGFGFRDAEQRLPVSENTLFPIGSATKAFTTFVMGQLADEAKLDFDEPVRTYLPELKLFDAVATERITPRDLVTHRSGLPGHDRLWYANTPRTRAELLGRLAFLPNNQDLRSKWQYNNLMYMTAGCMEEKLTGKTWEENIRQRILVPLGMKRTTLNNDDSQKDSDFALGYRQDFETDDVVRFSFRDIAAMGPAGSINSSVKEMANWVRLNLAGGAFEGKRLIQAATLKELMTPQMSMGGGPTDNPEVIPVGYAMGWFVEAYRGRRRLHHGGNIDGFTAMVSILPREQLGVVVLSNMNGSGLPDAATRHIFDRLTGMNAIDWSGQSLAQVASARTQAKQAKTALAATRKAGTQPSHPLEDYTGRFEHPGYGVLTIEKDATGKELTFIYNGIVTPLEHWHYDIFSGRKSEKEFFFESFKLDFVTGTDGEIVGVRAAMEPAEEPFTFTRLGDAKLSDATFLHQLVGEFAIEAQPVRFALVGSTLTATLPGQPVYELEPTRNATFRIKTLPGFTIQFIAGSGGAFDEARFVQPNGVFVARRVPAK